MPDLTFSYHSQMLNTNEQVYRILLDHDTSSKGRHIFDFCAAHILPAFNNSLVLEIKAEHRYSSSTLIKSSANPQIRELQHVLADGQIAWKQVFNVKMEKLMMFRDNELMFYDSYREEFVLVSLVDYSITTVKMPGIFEGTTLDVFVFGETGLLALTFKYHNMLEVRYYDSEGFKNGDSCLAAIVITLTTKRFEQLYKVNNRSLIGWPTSSSFTMCSSHKLVLDFVSYHR
jgi:hypothetical protein